MKAAFICVSTNSINKKYKTEIYFFLESIAERHARIFADEDLEFSRRRAEKHIRQDHVFDSRGARISRAGALLEDMDNNISDEVRRFFA